jgi:hypothetical protein
LAQPFKILTGLRSREFIVTDNFERRDDKTFWQVSCVFCNAKKYASTSQIHRNGIGRCKCQNEANPAKSAPTNPAEPKPRKTGKFTFPENQCKALVIEWQKTRCDRTFEEILKLVVPLNNILLNKKQIQKYCDMDECHQELAIKLFKILPKFDASRGSKLFSYLQCCLSRRIMNFAINSAKEPEFISIDYHEDSEGGHDCPGMFALNKKAIDNWRNGDSSASSAPAEESEWEFPAEEKQAMVWLVETLSPDSAADASAHILAELQRKFGLTSGRSKSLFWATLANLRRKKIYKRARAWNKIDRMLASIE